MHCGLNSNISFWTRSSPLVQWTLFMHGRQSFVSSCGTVVYTLNCENVHSSASGGGNIGFNGRCLTSEIPLHLLGCQNESDWTGFTCYENRHSQFELASLPSTAGILVIPLSRPVCEGYGNKHWKTAHPCVFTLHKKASLWLYVHDLRPNGPRAWRCEPVQLAPLLDLCLGVATLCSVSSSILLSGQFPVETQMASISIIVLRLFFVHSPGQLHQLFQWFGQK